jgi:D-threo-aldose 1-dehydrogenase
MNSPHSDILKNNISQSSIKLPPVIFGTSGLGNLFVALDEVTKFEIVKECIRHSSKPVVFDSAGKYGAGLALESLGKCLRALDVKPEDVIISNKLGWVRTELKTEEPTFEPGVWKNLKHDAVQKISYDGIIECFEQGNELLGGYIPQMVSVHDPDEYLATAADEKGAARLYNDILDAYKALYDLKQQGKVKAIGVGAKDWKIIQRIAGDVPLDWVMIANSLTIKNHPQELLDFIHELHYKGVYIINSAVFHSGFLVGSDYYDYKLISPNTPSNEALLQWRADFFQLCQNFGVKPAAACVQFAFKVPGVSSIALNTTSKERVKGNVDLASVAIPEEFWKTMKAKGLIRSDYPYV